jgi:outer membrane protein OmpU
MKYGSFPCGFPCGGLTLKKEGKMKKILLATSILAGTAGLAGAEVTLSGSARMGILNGFETDPTALDETGFTSRARVEFTMSGETDGGLSFGASFRADNAEGANRGEAGSVFISGAFGKLSMGDVDGAALAAVGHIDGVGLTGLGDLNESTYLGNGGLDDPTDGAGPATGTFTGDPSALYEYSAGGFGFYASVTNPSYTFDGDGDPATLGDTFEGDAYALGANYTMDAYKFSIGYEQLDVSNIAAPVTLEADHWIIGADATFGQVTVKARYGKADLDVNGAAALDFDQMGLSGTYAMDALSVTAYWQNKQFTDPAGVNVIETEAFGLGASYDLGGGAKVVGGIAQLEETPGAGPSVDDTGFDLGLSFSF